MEDVINTRKQLTLKRTNILKSRTMFLTTPKYERHRPLGLKQKFSERWGSSEPRAPRHRPGCRVPARKCRALAAGTSADTVSSAPQWPPELLLTEIYTLDVSSFCVMKKKGWDEQPRAAPARTENPQHKHPPTAPQSNYVLPPPLLATGSSKTSSLSWRVIEFTCARWEGTVRVMGYPALQYSAIKRCKSEKMWVKDTVTAM